MKLAMTLMIRDEADIIVPMLEHHLAQGIDTIIVTNNGSSDGTAEILEEYAERGVIDLRHDPVHRKQQGVVVTEMARDAARIHGADWVINADADEFWMPVDRSLTLHDVFEQLDPSMHSFTADVIDMIGPPAERGTGLQRLVYRDHRSQDQLNRVGLLAHSTPDAAHIADPDIVVHQGNHYVSLASRGAPPEQLRIEVLHFPWRSWEQYSRKVENAGRAYLNGSGLTPSPKHHGMRDYARLKAGLLLPSYVSRHPDSAELEAGLQDGAFVREDFLAERLASPVADVPFEGAVEEDARRTAVVLNASDYRAVTAERRLDDALREHQDDVETLRADIDRLTDEIRRTRGELEAARLRESALVSELEAMRRRRVVRMADAIQRSLPSRGGG